MCRAVSGETPYLSPAPGIPSRVTSAIIDTQLRTLTFVPCRTVPVSTENCLRQDPHFQTRRWVLAPVRVARDRPFAGRRK